MSTTVTTTTRRRQNPPMQEPRSLPPRSVTVRTLRNRRRRARRTAMRNRVVSSIVRPDLTPGGPGRTLQYLPNPVQRQVQSLVSKSASLPKSLAAEAAMTKMDQPLRNFCESVVSPFSPGAVGAIRPDRWQVTTVPATDRLTLQIDPSIFIGQPVQVSNKPWVVINVQAVMVTFLPRSLGIGWLTTLTSGTTDTLIQSALEPLKVTSTYLYNTIGLASTADQATTVDPLTDLYCLGITYLCGLAVNGTTKVTLVEWVSFGYTNDAAEPVKVVPVHTRTKSGKHFVYSNKVNVEIAPISAKLLESRTSELHITELEFKGSSISNIKRHNHKSSKSHRISGVNENEEDSDEQEEKRSKSEVSKGFSFPAVLETKSRFMGNRGLGGTPLFGFPQSLNTISYTRYSALRANITGARIIGAGIKLWSQAAPLTTSGLCHAGWFPLYNFASMFSPVMGHGIGPVSLSFAAITDALKYRQVYQGVDGATVRYSSLQSATQAISKLVDIDSIAVASTSIGGWMSQSAIASNDLISSSDYVPSIIWQYNSSVDSTTGITTYDNYVLRLESVVHLQCQPSALCPFINGSVQPSPLFRVVTQHLNDLTRFPPSAKGHSFASFFKSVGHVIAKVVDGVQKVGNFLSATTMFARRFGTAVAPLLVSEGG